MKISKRTLLIIGVVILVVIAFALNNVRSKQTREQSELNKKLEQVQTRIKGLPVEKASPRQAELEKQLSQATAQFEAVQAMLSQPLSSVAVTNRLFDIAKTNNLQVTKMTSSALASAKLGGLPCVTVPVSARVEGNLTNVVNFVAGVNSAFATGTINSIAITITGTGKEETASADINLVIYTRQGK